MTWLSLLVATNDSTACYNPAALIKVCLIFLNSPYNKSVNVQDSILSPAILILLSSDFYIYTIEFYILHLIHKSLCHTKGWLAGQADKHLVSLGLLGMISTVHTRQSIAFDTSTIHLDLDHKEMDACFSVCLHDSGWDC